MNKYNSKRIYYNKNLIINNKLSHKIMYNNNPTKKCSNKKIYNSKVFNRIKHLIFKQQTKIMKQNKYN
jgi:hypothetical protein